MLKYVKFIKRAKKKKSRLSTRFLLNLLFSINFLQHATTPEQGCWYPYSRCRRSLRS